MNNGFQRCLAGLTSFSILCSSVGIQALLLFFPLSISANGTVQNIFTSSGGTFTGSSTFLNQEGNYLSGNTVEFETNFGNASISNVGYKLSGRDLYGGTGSGRLETQIPSNNSFTQVGDFIGSGSFTTTFSGTYLSTGSVQFLDLVNGKYEFYTYANGDVLKYSFIVDNNLPYISGGIPLSGVSNTQAEIGQFLIYESNLSNLKLDYRKFGETLWQTKTLTGVQNSTNFLTQTGQILNLEPATEYEYSLLAIDFSGNQITETGSFATKAQGTTISSNLPLKLTHIPGNIANSTGSIVFTFTNTGSLPGSFSGFGINVPDSFIPSANSTLSYFSGSLSQGCQGGITKISNSGHTIFDCQFASPFTLGDGTTGQVKLSNITLPNSVGNYEEFSINFIASSGAYSGATFLGKTSIVSSGGDSSAPFIEEIYVQNPKKLIVKMNEELSGLPSLGTYIGTLRLDDYNKRFLILDTLSDIGIAGGLLSLQNAVDVAGNSGNTQKSFSGMESSTPYLTATSPNILPRGTSQTITIHGTNNIFSGSITSASFGGGISLGSFTKITNNAISVNIEIPSSTFLGPRNLEIDIQGKKYYLFNAIIIGDTAGTAANIATAQATVVAQIFTTEGIGSYRLSIPFLKPLSSTGVINIIFPNGYDISQAELDLTASINKINGSLKYQISLFPTSRKIQVHFLGGYIPTNEENLKIQFLGIKNPGVSGNYSLQIESRDSDGTLLEELQTGSIYIGGTPGTISPRSLQIQLRDAGGQVLPSSSGGVISLRGVSGNYELLANASGNASFTGGINEKFFISIDPVLKIKSGGNYTQSQYITNSNSREVVLDTNKTIVFQLTDTGTNSFITAGGTITNGSGKTITLRVNSQGKYFEFDLNNGNPLPSNSYTYGVRVPKKIGYTLFSIYPSELKNNIKSVTSTLWVPSKALGRTVGENNIGDINISISESSSSLVIQVQDGEGNKVPDANIYLYSPSGQIEGQFGTTNLNGERTFQTPPGTYSYGAQLAGGIKSQEYSITLGANTSIQKILIVKIPKYTLGGYVFQADGTPVLNGEMFAVEATSQTSLRTRIDSSGYFQFFVDSGDWRVSGNTSQNEPIDPQIIPIGSESKNSLIFNQNTSTSYSFYGSLRIGNASGSGVSQAMVSLQGTSSSSGKSIYKQVSSQENGDFLISVPNGNYSVWIHHPEYGNIAKDSFTIQGSNLERNYFVSNLQSLGIEFTGPGVPQDMANFSWILQMSDASNGKKYTQRISSQSEYEFQTLPSGLYQLQIQVAGLGQVYSSGSFQLNQNQILTIPLGEKYERVRVTGQVNDFQGQIPLSDVYIEVRDIEKKITQTTKSNGGGNFEFFLPKNTPFEFFLRKPGYQSTEVFSQETFQGEKQLGTYSLKSISGSGITVSGNLTSTGGSLEGKKAVFTLIGIDNQGEESSKGITQEILLQSNGFFEFSGIPEQFGVAKIAIGVEGFFPRRTDGIFLNGSRNIGSIPLQIQALKDPYSLPITPSIGGIAEDEDGRFRIQLPANTLGNGNESHTVGIRETSAIPGSFNKQILGGTAQEIEAQDSDGIPITNLQNDAVISFRFSGSELVDSSQNISLEDIRAIHISYYDTSTSAWVPLETTLESSSSGLFSQYSSNTLLRNIPNYENIIFTLTALTDHFTLFTALVSTAVSNSQPVASVSSGGGGGGGGGSSVQIASTPKKDTSIITGIQTTSRDIGKYLGDTQQTIVLKSGKTLESSLAIKRDGTPVQLRQILAQGSTSISNKGQNFVKFTIGDTLSTYKGGSIELAIDGYSKVGLSPLSSVKIVDAGVDFLTYENLNGQVKYDFTKNNEGKFQYKVQGKTGYATIRGTSLTVNSKTNSDTYVLLTGKIDVYNTIKKTTVSLLPGDSYTLYTDGKDNFVKAPQKQNITPCGTYKDVDKAGEWCPYISKLAKKGVINQVELFRPDGSVTRAELIKMGILTAGITPKFNPKYSFNDISEKDWVAPYASVALELGYIERREGKLLPNEIITRAEAITFLMKVRKIKLSYSSKYTYGDIKSDDWFAPYVSGAKRFGYISSTQKNFRPYDSIRRSEVAKILTTIFNLP